MGKNLNKISYENLSSTHETCYEKSCFEYHAAIPFLSVQTLNMVNIFLLTVQPV